LSYPGLTINPDKTVFSSKKHNRHVTGITITNEGKASIGHKKKREIKSMTYQVGSGETSPVELRKLKGLLAFVRSVEPEFYDKLKTKYPDQIKIISDSRYVVAKGDS